ncbi:hypothetical protein KEM52_006142 [Ascosphaera acerosa]|nr:hypothetical protein KEM52_006142 [Ascosphaera acerosa]
MTPAPAPAAPQPAAAAEAEAQAKHQTKVAAEPRQTRARARALKAAAAHTTAAESSHASDGLTTQDGKDKENSTTAANGNGRGQPAVARRGGGRHATMKRQKRPLEEVGKDAAAPADDDTTDQATTKKGRVTAASRAAKQASSADAQSSSSSSSSSSSLPDGQPPAKRKRAGRAAKSAADSASKDAAALAANTATDAPSLAGGDDDGDSNGPGTAASKATPAASEATTAASEAPTTAAASTEPPASVVQRTDELDVAAPTPAEKGAKSRAAAKKKVTAAASAGTKKAAARAATSKSAPKPRKERASQWVWVQGPVPPRNPKKGDKAQPKSAAAATRHAKPTAPPQERPRDVNADGDVSDAAIERALKSLRKAEKSRTRRSEQGDDDLSSSSDEADNIGMNLPPETMIGQYRLSCPEIQDQWPDQAKRLRMAIMTNRDVSRAGNGLIASFHLGIVEGTMLLASSIEAAQKIRNRIARDALVPIKRPTMDQVPNEGPQARAEKGRGGPSESNGKDGGTSAEGSGAEGQDETGAADQAGSNEGKQGEESDEAAQAEQQPAPPAAQSTTESQDDHRQQQQEQQSAKKDDFEPRPNRLFFRWRGITSGVGNVQTDNYYDKNNGWIDFIVPSESSQGKSGGKAKGKGKPAAQDAGTIRIRGVIDDVEGLGEPVVFTGEKTKDTGGKKPMSWTSMGEDEEYAGGGAMFF